MASAPICTAAFLGLALVGMPPPRVSRTPLKLWMSQQVSEDAAVQAGYAAGVAAGQDAARASGSSGQVKNRGRAFSVILKTKPLGLLLEENPSGRGVSVSEITNGTAAARRGGIEVGDYVIGISSQQQSADLTWLNLSEVQELVAQARTPVTLQLRRGGPEPWTIQRDSQGLSVDDMIDETRREFGTLLDDDQEDALRAAFAAIKEEEVRSAKENAGAGGFESIALRSASKLSYELRAFTLGVQESLARVVQLATNRALLDSKVAIKSAEYLLRRAIFDSGRVLAAGRVALALGAAPTDADRKAQAEVSPFAARLSKINNVRQLGRASTESQRALGAAIEEEEKTREQLLAEKAAAEEALRREAADLLREAIGGIEEWVREARRREEQRSKQERQDVNTSNGAAATPSRGPNWLRLQQRARVVGGELGAALSISLEELRSDFSAYVELDAQGQLPTLVEEAEDAAAAATGSLRGGGIGSVLNNGMLGGLSVGDDSSKRRERAARLETDLEIKKAKLAATVASRASKDVSDAAVYGVLPTAKAISKVAAQRAAEKIASTMGSAVGSKPRQGVSRSRESPEGSGNFLRDVASQIADEYKRDIERGAKYGPLADAADVFKGPTKAIKKDLEDVAALGLSALNGLLAPSPSATNASTQVLEDFDASRRGTLVDGEADRTDRITRSVGEQTPAVDLSTMEQATQHAPSAPSRQQKVASPPPAPRALEVEVIEVESFVVEARASYTEDIDIPEDETTKMDGGSRTLPEPSGGSRGMGTRIAGAGEEFDIGSGIVVQTRTRDAKTSGVDDVREASDDALDIDVSAQVEEDVEEVRNERRAKVLDASLVLLELGVQRVGTILGRVMTTEEGRSWELLQSLQERDKTKMARSAKATAALLEEIINLVGRK